MCACVLGYACEADDAVNINKMKYKKELKGEVNKTKTNIFSSAFIDMHGGCPVVSRCRSSVFAFSSRLS